jgi:ribosome-associated protein
MLIINSQIKIPLKEFKFSFARSSGPGGQNVNKVNSKAILRWNVRETKYLPEEIRERLQEIFENKITGEGILVVSSQKFRDQMSNAASCIDKVRAIICEAADIPDERVATKPTKSSKTNRITTKRKVGAKKSLRKPPQDDDFE